MEIQGLLVHIGIAFGRYGMGHFPKNHTVSGYKNGGCKLAE
jgi:hypothetical protein